MNDIEAHLRILRRGDVFKKYNKIWTVHRRYLWLDETDNTLKWRALGNSKNKAKEKGMLLTEVTDVLLGSNGSAFGKIGSTGNLKLNEVLLCKVAAYNIISVLPAPDSSLCFSIRSKTHILDLEAESSTTRDKWVLALQTVLAVNNAAALASST